MSRLERTERIFTPVGLVLAVLAAIGLYLWRSSIWLALFGFVMVSRFMVGSVPKIMYHRRKIRRTLFYLLWPAGGTAILYLTYQLWGRMWLSALLGIIGGMIFSVLVGAAFFRGIAVEEQQREEEVAEHVVGRQLTQNAAAVAMKERFTGSEWDEIKQFPWMVFGGVAAMTGSLSKEEMNVWAEAVVKPETYADPLLRMMLIDWGAGLTRSMGQMTSLSQLSSVASGGVLHREFERLAGSGRLQAELEGLGTVTPQAMRTIEANLNPDEFRSFVRSLAKLGFATAAAGDPPTREQISAVLTFVPAESKEDLFAMLDVQEH